MLLKELILASLENIDNFKIQQQNYNGTLTESTLTNEKYLQLANEEIESYYLDTDENNKPYISIKLENND